MFTVLLKSCKNCGVCGHCVEPQCHFKSCQLGTETMASCVSVRERPSETMASCVREHPSETMASYVSVRERPIELLSGCPCIGWSGCSVDKLLRLKAHLSPHALVPRPSCTCPPSPHALVPHVLVPP